MFRSSSITSQFLRRAQQQQSSYRGRIPTAFGSLQQQQFHGTSKRDEDAAKPTTTPSSSSSPVVVGTEESKSSWDPIYALPIGIAFAIPVVHYEWYLFNEETQLAACMIMFTALVYKNFGASMGEMLEQDGKRITEEANKVEDSILSTLKQKKQDLIMMKGIVKDAQDIHTLKEETYVKYNAAGKIKPLHEFKAQMERVLHMVAVEEAAVTEKTKTALMEEATIAVTNELLTNKDLQKKSLDNAIAQLKGTKPGDDPVKQTYLQFFQWKANEAKSIDTVAETVAAREQMVKKVNAIAANEKFFFQLNNDGKPKMMV